MKKSSILIKSDSSIGELQDQFSCLYPYLTIRFFINEHNGKEFSCQSIMLAPDVKTCDLNKNFEGGMLEIADTMTIKEIEDALYEQFGLSVQIVENDAYSLWDPASIDHGTMKWGMNRRREVPNHHHHFVYSFSHAHAG